MELYLPVAEMPVNVLWLLGLGLVVGFLSGLFGVGGGFMLTPLLTIMGIPPTIAVGTQANQLAGTSLSGVMLHWRKKSLDLRMGIVLTIGSFVGSGFGVQLFKWLKQIGQVNLVIMLGYVALLSVIGCMMVAETLPHLMSKKDRQRSVSRVGGRHDGDKEIDCKHDNGGWLVVSFPASQLRLNVLLPLSLGLLGGVLVALLGIGGGFVLVPAMIYVLKMPPGLVNGTSLFQILFATAFATILQATTNHSVDVILALILLVGSVVSVPMGARLAARLRPELARFLMALLVLAVAGKMIYDLVSVPVHPFVVEMRALS